MYDCQENALMTGTNFFWELWTPTCSAFSIKCLVSLQNFLKENLYRKLNFLWQKNLTCISSKIWMTTECVISASSPYPSSVENCSFAVREDTDGPRWQIILRIAETHFCGECSVIVCQECSTFTRFWIEYMSLVITKW